MVGLWSHLQSSAQLWKLSIHLQPLLNDSERVTLLPLKEESDYLHIDQFVLDKVHCLSITGRCQGNSVILDRISSISCRQNVETHVRIVHCLCDFD